MSAPVLRVFVHHTRGGVYDELADCIDVTRWNDAARAVTDYARTFDKRVANLSGYVARITPEEPRGQLVAVFAGVGAKVVMRRVSAAASWGSIAGMLSVTGA